MAQDLEMTREDGVVLLVRRRGWGWGLACLLLAGFFLFGGIFCAITGQHLPKISSLETAAWALLLGALLLPMGLGLTKNGEWFAFSPNGVRVDFFRLRAIHWFLEYPITRTKSIKVETQTPQGRRFRVILEVQDRPQVTLAEALTSEEAWQLASALAEPAMLPVHER